MSETAPSFENSEWKRKPTSSETPLSDTAKEYVRHWTNLKSSNERSRALYQRAFQDGKITRELFDEGENNYRMQNEQLNRYAQTINDEYSTKLSTDLNNESEDWS